jgi:hypothetical protein
MVQELTEAERFFYENAPFSYRRPETPEEGRRRGAVELAAAETRAVRVGVWFGWESDDIDSSDHSDEQPAYGLWRCLMFDGDNEALASLGAVDFGRDGNPVSHPYARVVQAEMAAAWTYENEEN